MTFPSIEAIGPRFNSCSAYGLAPAYVEEEGSREHFLQSANHRENVIWMATCWWCLCGKRNDILLNDDIGDIGDVVFNIKLIFGFWLVIGTKNRRSCSFYKWCNCPLDLLKLS